MTVIMILSAALSAFLFFKLAHARFAEDANHIDTVGIRIDFCAHFLIGKSILSWRRITACLVLSILTLFFCITTV